MVHLHFQYGQHMRLTTFRIKSFNFIIFVIHKKMNIRQMKYNRRVDDFIEKYTHTSDLCKNQIKHLQYIANRRGLRFILIQKPK